MSLTTPQGYPGPIWTNDSNAFAHDTMQRRVPATIRNVIDRNPDYHRDIVNDLRTLEDAITVGGHVAVPNWEAPDRDHWQAAVDGRGIPSWLDTDWFFAETYFYRLLIDRVRWWTTEHDPFESNKDEEYATETHWHTLEAALAYQSMGSLEDRLGAAINGSLWGNRIDLSFVASRSRGVDASDDDLLIDNLDAAVEHLASTRIAETRFGEMPVPIHMILDNAGTELSMDMVLADCILSMETAYVVLHVKHHPTFVSDVIPVDIWHWFELMRWRGGQFARLGERLFEAFDTSRLFIRPHLFWNSSDFLWEMPYDLIDSFGLKTNRAYQQARLTIVKGDANYRRMVGDAFWPAETPFGQVTGYFERPLLALRTLKSDPIVGLQPGDALTLDTIDPAWRVNGQRGVIQFKP